MRIFPEPAILHILAASSHYNFDSAGRVAMLKNPANWLQYQTSTDPAGNPTYAPCIMTFGYDAMGRPSSVGSCVNWVQNVQYDYAGRLVGAQYLDLPASTYLYEGYGSYDSEARSYNVNGQLASIRSQNFYGFATEMQYSYPATQNNWQVSQEVDSYYGGSYVNTINYQYDALKRATSAAMTNTTGAYLTPWTEAFQYDGFGNLTAKVLNGTTTPMTVNAATNRLANAYYDANGNMTSGAGATFTYDEANRVRSVSTVAGGQETFAYAPDNRQIFRTLASGQQEITFYGGKGERLGVFGVGGEYLTNTSCCGNTPQSVLTMEPGGMTLSFAGRTVVDGLGTTPVLPDRLGTNRSSGASYYPYGEEITSTANDTTKFATYNRDSYSGIDYADQPKLDARHRCSGFR